MASLRVLAFDHDGRPFQFDTWLNDLQLYLMSDIKDGVSLFDHMSGAATAPPTTADGATRSQWLSRDAAARLAIRNHLPLAECAHFAQHRTAQALYDADLVSHRASDARYRAAVPAEFLDKNQPPMFITLYFIVTRLPDSLCSVRDHFLSLDPISLNVDLLEQHLLAAKTSAVAVGAARGTPRPPFFEGCSPFPLAPSYASAAAADVSVAEDVGTAFASAKCRSGKGKGGKGGGGGSGGGGGGSGSSGGGSSGGGGGGGTAGGSGGSGGGSGGSGGSGGGGGSGTGGGGTGARRGGSGGGQRQQQQRRSKTPSPQQLREWFLRGASGGSCPYVIRTGDRAGQTCKEKGGKGGGGGSGGGGGGSGSSGGGSSGGGGGGGTAGGSGGSGGGSGGSGGRGGGEGCGTSGGGTGAWRGGSGGGQRQQQQHQSETPSPQQLREWFLRGASGGSCPYVIRTGDRAGQTCGQSHTQHHCFYHLDDAWRAEFGDDIELPRWADMRKSRIAIFDLDFDAILSAMHALSVSAEGDCYRCVPPDLGIVAAALGASASGTLPGIALAEALHTFTLDSGLHLPSFSTNLVSTAALEDSMVTTTTPGGQRVPICTCTWTGRHLAMFTRRPWSSLYTLATEPSQVAASAQVSASSQVAASCSCRLLSHQTLLWHNRLGQPSLPRLHGMHSRLLVSGPPRSLTPLPPSPALRSLRRGAADSSSFPPTTAPLQTLHMDVWGPARVSGQSRERYFMLEVDDYTRYTMVFPLCSKGQVVDVLIPWIRTVRLQFRERFGQDHPVLRLHSDRGGEFSSNLLRDFCRGKGILQSFTLSDSPQQNGIAERSIGLVMEVARTSMIHAAAPQFLWPFAVRYAAHQLNLWPRVSLPETLPTPRWTEEVGDASLYHLTSRHVFPSQDVTFDESVPFYRLFPYCSAPPPPAPLFLAPSRPPVDPLSPQGPSPSGVSQVDPLSGPAPVQVAVGSGAPVGAVSGGAEPGSAKSEGAETGGAEPGGVATGGGEPRGAEPEGVEPGGAASEGAESGGAEPQGADSSGGSAGASLRLSPQQLREWFVQHTHLRSGAFGAGGAGAAGAGGTGVAAGAGVTGGSATTAGDLTGSCATGAGVARAGGAGVGGLGAGGARVGGTGVGGAGDGGVGAVDPGECHELASFPVLPVRTARCVPRSRPPLVPGTHSMALHPSSVPLRVPLPAPPESSLPEVPDPESDRARAARPTVSRLLATAVTDPSLEFAAASALVAELLDFAAAYRLDYATALIVESASASPPSIGGECAIGMDVLEDRQEDFECLAPAVPRFASLLLAPEGDTDALDCENNRQRKMNELEMRWVHIGNT
ncbi:unnamed protein product [Closterium sp. NIES-53]